MRGERQNKHWLKRRHRRRTHLCSALQYSSCDASSDGELFAFDSKKRSVSALGRDVSQSAARPTIEKLKRGVVVRDRSATETADATRGNADEVARRRNMRCAINVLANLFSHPSGFLLCFALPLSSSPSFIHKVTSRMSLSWISSPAGRRILLGVGAAVTVAAVLYFVTGTVRHFARSSEITSENLISPRAPSTSPLHYSLSSHHFFRKRQQRAIKTWIYSRNP